MRIAIALALSAVAAEDACTQLHASGLADVAGRGTISRLMDSSTCTLPNLKDELGVCQGLVWNYDFDDEVALANLRWLDQTRFVACNEALELVKDFPSPSDACGRLHADVRSFAGKGAVLRTGNGSLCASTSSISAAIVTEDSAVCSNLFWVDGRPVSCDEAAGLERSVQPSSPPLTPQFDPTNWLSHFSDFRVVDLPIIPGTHNSGASQFLATAILPWVRNQHRSIADQLLLGVRFLDLRLHAVKDEVRISHTADTVETLANVLATVKSFLEANRSEFVILFCQSDSDYPYKTDADRELTLATFIDSGIQYVEFTQENPIGTLTVRNAGGKVILLTRPWEVLPGVGTGRSDFVSFDYGALNHRFLSTLTDYAICDLWYSKFWLGPGGAAYRLSRCMHNYVGQRQRNILHGIAVDFTLLGVPPAMHAWRFNGSFWGRFDALPMERKRRPFGIVMVDFFDQQTSKRILAHALAYKVGSL